jgi:hypothetical protein
MCDRGNLPVTTEGKPLRIITAASLALVLSWPLVGAGQGGGGSRAALSLAWRVEGKATLVVEPRLRGRFQWPGESFVDRPQSYPS